MVGAGRRTRALEDLQAEAGNAEVYGNDGYFSCRR